MCVHGQDKLGKFTWVKRECEYIEATGPLDDVKVVFKGLLGIRGGTATCVAFQNVFVFVFVFVFVLPLPRMYLTPCLCICILLSNLSPLESRRYMYPLHAEPNIDDSLHLVPDL